MNGEQNKILRNQMTKKGNIMENDTKDLKTHNQETLKMLHDLCDEMQAGIKNFHAEIKNNDSSLNDEREKFRLTFEKSRKSFTDLYKKHQEMGPDSWNDNKESND